MTDDADEVTEPDSEEASFRRLVRLLDPAATLLQTWPLTGGVSATVTVVELARANGERERVIVRRHGEADLGRNPHVARDEFALLHHVHGAGLPVPRPLLASDAGDPFPAPALVIAFVEGATEFAPANQQGYLTTAATTLARIHRLAASPELAFLPRLVLAPGRRPAQLDVAMGEGRIRDALASAANRPQANPNVLLHGDYWPGNLLWRDGELAAVIDWEDAHTGDPLADLGNSRLEFLWAFGPEAMAAFTSAYLAQAKIDTSNLPAWDLWAALRPCGKLGTWGLEPDDERRMRDQHAWFVDQALAALA